MLYYYTYIDIELGIELIGIKLAETLLFAVFRYSVYLLLSSNAVILFTITAFGFMEVTQQKHMYQRRM